jgi:hypothetical protein
MKCLAPGVAVFARFAAVIALPAQTPPDREASLEASLATAQAHAREAGDRLFAGYSRAPFGILLEADGKETLLCHGRVDGFVATGTDEHTGCPRQTQDKQHFPENLLAAMPALDRESVIVMGSPEKTGLTRAQWVRTIYHEHFHQYTSALPGYYERVGALNLANGDTTGMWMLNYPFPYDDAKVQGLYRAAAEALADAAESRGTGLFNQRAQTYLHAREAFEQGVSPAAWRYFEFQLWNEGVARWMEIAMGKTDSDPAVQEASRGLEASSVARLRTDTLSDRRREVVYGFGAAEAMLMESAGAGWREAYPGTLALGGLLRQALVNRG